MGWPSRGRHRVVPVLIVVLALAAPLGMVVGFTLFAGGAMLGGAGTACLRVPGDGATVFEVQSSAGMRVPLDAAQLDNARTMLRAAADHGADEAAVVVMLMTALQESKLRNLANTTVPDSLNLPNDGTGHDHDSVGVLQQRPSQGWGTVAELMDPAFAARAFLGGPHGPNAGSPAGLFDHADWASLTPGTAAQRVQVSAFPDAYDQWLEAALRILDHLGVVTGGCDPSAASGDGAYPLASPAVITDGVGPRPCRVAGSGGCASSTWHPALDFGAPCGVAVLAARPGTVTVVSGYWVTITTDDGTAVSYLHMYPSDVVVALGDRVEAGQVIGAVGNAGPSTGCHLDFRVNALTTSDPAVAALPHIGDASVAPGFVDPADYMALYGVDLLGGAGV